ncbi:MAG: hypothetical protein ABJC09_05125, partial [Terriglobia bacterium]
WFRGNNAVLQSPPSQCRRQPQLTAIRFSLLEGPRDRLVPSALRLLTGSMPPDLESNCGFIPVSLDEISHKVRWRDVGRFHFYQGFFNDALKVCSALQGKEPEILLSDLKDLPPTEGGLDSLTPTAFIFHAGRCGSTLLAKILARSREHLVFGEAAPHSQIWNLLPPDADGATDLYRRLILAMGRRRLPSYRAHIIKFTSFNVLEARFIRRAFPGVPSLFLFRRPDAMLASYRREPPSWLGFDHKLVRDLATPESAVEAFFTAALSITKEDFRYLDYERLTPESLPEILRYLRLQPPASDIPLMLNEFSWNAKSASPEPFNPQGPENPGPVPPSIEALYRQLKERSFDPTRKVLSHRS